MNLPFLFNPLDDRWFAFMCSTAFGCWWMWMLLMPKAWAHVPLRRLPVAMVPVVLLHAALWPLVMVAQFALGYDWRQFGNDGAGESETRLPATVTGQNRGERPQPPLASREIDVHSGAIRGAMYVCIPALLMWGAVAASVRYFVGAAR